VRRRRSPPPEEIARACVRRLEETCLRFPAQWFDVYDVWDEGGAG